MLTSVTARPRRASDAAASQPIKPDPITTAERAVAPRWLAYLGYASAGLIATGVVVPLGLDIARLTNFAGYVAWCAWLVAMAVVLWRTKRPTGGSTADRLVKAADGAAR